MCSISINYLKARCNFILNCVQLNHSVIILTNTIQIKAFHLINFQNFFFLCSIYFVFLLLFTQKEI